MTAIDRYIEETQFSPEVIAILRDAYDRACRTLHDIGQPAVVHEVLAERIINLAKAGERDSKKLCDEALSGLGVHGKCD